MGNVESGPHGGSSSSADANYWHGASPRSAPSLRPPPERGMLQRKASSFLEEPVTHKLTERGRAAVTLRDAGTGGGDGRDVSVDEDEATTDDASFLPRHSRLADHKTLRYAVSEMQGWRAHMEDKHVLNPALSSNRQQRELLKDHHLFAVFDGHGGEFASHYCGEHFVSTLLAQKDWQTYLKLSSGGGDALPSHGHVTRITARQDSVTGLALLKSALTSTFLELDAKLMDAQRNVRLSQLAKLENLVYSLGGTVEHDVFIKGTAEHRRVLNFDRTLPASMPANVPLERSGSTAVVVLITPSHILCANAGDSRAILSKKSNSVILSKDGVLPLSFDHKPNNDVEVTRVERDGGFVRAGRVDGDLAVSRSFGDFGYKNCSNRDGGDGPAPESRESEPTDHRVTVYPDILVHTREPSRDEFIVLACDGIWDRLSNRECADLVRSLVREEGETDVGLICEEIIDTALELDSRDNMTCCLVMFPGMADAAGESDAISIATSSTTSSGVLRRRYARERQWGRDSTPAKRAHQRLEERRKRNRELVALQRSKVPKSQGRRQRAQPNLQLSPSQEHPRPPQGVAPSLERTRSVGGAGEARKHTSSRGGIAMGRTRSTKSALRQ